MTCIPEKGKWNDAANDVIELAPPGVRISKSEAIAAICWAVSQHPTLTQEEATEVAACRASHLSIQRGLEADERRLQGKG